MATLYMLDPNPLSGLRTSPLPLRVREGRSDRITTRRDHATEPPDESEGSVA
jgi:hypothetical protein